MSKRWTEEETEFLKNKYTEGVKACAEVLGRTEIAISRKATKLGIKFTRIDLWSDKELEFLKKWYSVKGPQYCCNNLKNRSKTSVHLKANRLGLAFKCKTNTKLTDYEYKVKLENTEYKSLEPYVTSGVPIMHEHSCGFKWLVRPNDLSKLKGCPGCSIGGSGFNPTKPAHFYWVKFEDLDGLEKIGISNNINRRFKEFGYKPSTIKKVYFEAGYQAIELENYYKQLLKPYMLNTNLLDSGNTETFKL